MVVMKKKFTLLLFVFFILIDKCFSQDQPPPFFHLDSIIKKHILNADIIIDGIFGTGIKGDIQDPHLSVIKLINHSKSYIVSVDIPSGLNPNNGEISIDCVRANTTITFHRIKTGLLNNRKYTGNLILKKIGIPIEAEEGIV